MKVSTANKCPKAKSSTLYDQALNNTFALFVISTLGMISCILTALGIMPIESIKNSISPYEGVLFLLFLFSTFLLHERCTELNTKIQNEEEVLH